MKRICFSLWAFLLLAHAGWTQQKVSGFLLTTSSNEAKSSFSQGMQFIDLGEGKKAREAFQKALQQDPKLAIAYIYIASLAPTPQEFASNLSKAKENLANASEWEKLFYDYTESFLTNDLDKRLKTAQTMVAKFPDMARSHELLGETYAASKDYARARQNYEKAIAVEPSWPGGYSALAISYLFENPRDFKMAEKNAAKLTQLAPNSAGAQILLGDTYRAQNELQKARDAYAKAVQLDPDSPEALYKRGHAYTFLGDYEKARADYQQAGSLDVVPTFALESIAYTYLYQGEPAKALQVLMDEADKINQQVDASKATAAKFELLTSAAMIAFHMNDGQKLQSIVDKMEPLSDEIGNSMGAEEARINQKSTMLLWKGIEKTMNKDFMNAMAKAEEMKTTLEPIQNPRKLEDYEALMGYINYQQKKYKDAITHFEKSDMLNMYNKYWLAKAYEAAGKKEKAMAIYKEIANYNFNNIGYALIRNEVSKK